MTEKQLFNGFNREAARKQLGKDIEILYRKCGLSAADIAREAGISPNTIKDIRDGKTSIKLDSCFMLLDYLLRQLDYSLAEARVITERYLMALFY